MASNTVRLIPELLEERAERACRVAVLRWGASPQFRQAQEEFAELIAAINRLDRGREGALEQLLEEIADASLCLLQLRLMLGSEVETHQERKLRRLEQRLLLGEQDAESPEDNRA